MSRPAARKPAAKPKPKPQHFNAALVAQPPRIVVAGLRTDLSFTALRGALLVALAHVALIVAGRALALPALGVAALRPAGGLLLAALLLVPRRQWPLILALTFLAQLAAGPLLGGQLVELSLGFAVAAGVQAYIAARVLARLFRLPLALRSLPEVLALAGAALLAGAAGGLLEAAVSVAAGGAPSLWGAWRAWALADALGMVVIAPLLLAAAGLAQETNSEATPRRLIEPVLALAALAGATVFVFRARPDAPGVTVFAALVLPFLLWAAVRLGRPGAALGGLLLSGLAAWFTAHGQGPFAAPALAAADQLLWLQIYLGVTVLSTVSLAGVLARRKRAAIELQQAHAKLSTWARDLEQRNRQVAALTRMGDLLQSCMTADDAYHVIALAGPQLFPGLSGALYLLTPEAERAWAAATWGPLHLPDHGFAHDDCLALRRGRLYVVGLDRPSRPCRHVHPTQGLPYLCMPLAALGEVMGVLHLSAAGPQAAAGLPEATVELAHAAADSMALALGYVRLRQALREQSIRDPLTGLFNRRYMEETLERELRRAGRGGYPVGVVMLDLDRFKAFNDTFGHEAGDAALRELGNYLRLQVRGEDVACRYGGEEFVLVLPNASLEVTRGRAEQLREGVKQLHLQYQGQALGPLTLSLGLALFPAHGVTSTEILRAADRALYRAKDLGRDRLALASD